MTQLLLCPSHEREIISVCELARSRRAADRDPYPWFVAKFNMCSVDHETKFQSPRTSRSHRAKRQNRMEFKNDDLQSARTA